MLEIVSRLKACAFDVSSNTRWSQTWRGEVERAGVGMRGCQVPLRTLGSIGSVGQLDSINEKIKGLRKIFKC